MAANMKAVKLRIKSVESTMQITKAMELVASSKLRKAKERADTCRPYFQELYRTLQDIAKVNTEFYSIYAKEAKNEKCCYVLVAGDRGLAGGYNANLFRCFEADAKGKEICVVPVGKKAVEYAKSRKLEILTDSFAEIANLSVADSFEIARALCETIEVVDTKKENNLPIHITKKLPEHMEAPMMACVDTDKRAACAANHSATHLLDAALREVLGDTHEGRTQINQLFKTKKEDKNETSN